MREDRAICADVERANEVADNVLPAGLDRGGATVGRAQQFGGSRFQDEREEGLADIDLGSANGESEPRRALQVEVMLLEPLLRGTRIAPDRRPRRLDLSFQILQMDRIRRAIKQCN